MQRTVCTHWPGQLTICHWHVPSSARWQAGPPTVLPSEQVKLGAPGRGPLHSPGAHGGGGVHAPVGQPCSAATLPDWQKILPTGPHWTASLPASGGGLHAQVGQPCSSTTLPKLQYTRHTGPHSKASLPPSGAGPPAPPLPPVPP